MSGRRPYVSGCVGCGIPGVPFDTYCSDTCWWVNHPCKYTNGRCACSDIDWEPTA